MNDCRGPGAADRGDPAPTNYKAKVYCTDAACACPEGYSRYGARCLKLLDQLESDWWAAQSACRALGAHLAVPRSGPEQDQINLAAAGARTRVWLGVHYRALYSKDFFGLDGNCGGITQFFWASGEQPANHGDGAVSHSPPALAGNTGWYFHQGHTGGPYHPLCQLLYCYRPDCEA